MTKDHVSAKKSSYSSAEEQVTYILDGQGRGRVN